MIRPGDFLQKMDGGAHEAADSDAQPLLPMRPSDVPDLEAPAGARSLQRTATPDPRGVGGGAAGAAFSALPSAADEEQERPERRGCDAVAARSFCQVSALMLLATVVLRYREADSAVETPILAPAVPAPSPPPDLCAGVVCPEPSSACRIAGGCLPASGACAAEVGAPDGTPCDDRDPTTEGDACVSGTCAGIFRWALTDYTTVVRTLLQLSSARNPLP